MPEEAGVRYVAREVAQWPAENRCFSCHNNGDGARALILASRLKVGPGVQPLDSTLEWLQKPDEWGKNNVTAFGDQKLARIQFAAALADAVDAGIIKDKSLVARASTLLVTHQEKDGSWQVDAQGSRPSAVTYGPVLATFMARRTLERAGDARFQDAIARADSWLRGADMPGVVNAAAIVLALESRKDSASKASVERALDTLVKSQNSDGGWGPFAKNPAQPFETAMALLALNAVGDRPDLADRISKARAFLISVQFEDGGWPSAVESTTGGTYARHMSTSAWATLALLATKR
jgi:squalene cyclase